MKNPLTVLAHNALQTAVTFYGNAVREEADEVERLMEILAEKDNRIEELEKELAALKGPGDRESPLGSGSKAS
jgi:predicted RNase H-like nuclease (RuvC/YqgF family)